MSAFRSRCRCIIRPFPSSRRVHHNRDLRATGLGFARYYQIVWEAEKTEYPGIGLHIRSVQSESEKIKSQPHRLECTVCTDLIRSVPSCDSCGFVRFGLMWCDPLKLVEAIRPDQKGKIRFLNDRV